MLSVQSYVDSEVTVTVKCPEDGNSSVTEYRIEYQLHSSTSNMLWLQQEFIASNPQPFVVSSLSPFTEYIFRATARNIHGYSESSAAVNMVVVTTAEGCKALVIFVFYVLLLHHFLYLLDPGYPNSVSLSGNASARWFVLSWSPPSVPYGIPRYYFVHYKAISFRQVKNLDSGKTLNVTDTWANLTILIPFTRYSVEVAAVNVRSHDGKVLEGQRSTAIIVNTEEDGMFVYCAPCI